MFRASSSFDRLLDKATSNLLLEPDWVSTMAICDAIRSGETPPKYAVNAIKKKFYHENPHVVLYALQVMESCVKNCGSLVHDEIATKAFMEELREMVKHSQEENVKGKLLELLQTWGMAFRNTTKYRIVTDTLDVMKAEGWSFPPVREAEAMYEADNAPDWAEGEVCHRCRVEFGLVTRQHHCRACGQVFCGKCSAKSCTLPKFGIEREVRVCDSCFEQYGPKVDGANSSPSKTLGRHRHGNNAGLIGLPGEYLASSLAQQSQAPPSSQQQQQQQSASSSSKKNANGKTDAELKEEEELQLAIALSQSEAQAKEDAKKRGQLGYSSPKRFNDEPKESKKSCQASSTGGGGQSEELAPELMRYLNRDYWEKKEKDKAENKAAAAASGHQAPKEDPAVQQQALQQTPMMQPAAAAPVTQLPPALAGGASEEELDEFVTTLKTQVEIFVNRMKSNSSRGRSITNDSSVQTLFMNTMAMHSKLLKHIQDQEDKRVYYEGLQDKIAQVKDARAALDALREEERERKRREAEEAERLRQIQMREKLEVMRKKKQEYLQYQRQVALQGMQEREREMKLRQEQAKQQYHMMMAGQQPPQAMPPQAMPPQYMYNAGAGMMQPPQQMMPQGGYMGYPPPSAYMPPATAAAGNAPEGMMPSQPGMMPPQQQQPPVTTAESGGAFNMQAVAGALPPQPPQQAPPAQVVPPQQPMGYMPGQQQAPPPPMNAPGMPPQQQPDPSMMGAQQQMVPQMQPAPAPMQAPLPQQQQGAPLPEAPSASLISFD